MQSVQVFFSLASALIYEDSIILSSEEWTGNATSILSEWFQDVSKGEYLLQISLYFIKAY